MPLVRLLEPVAIRKESRGAGEVVRVKGQEASRLVSEGRAVLVREQPHENTARK